MRMHLNSIRNAMSLWHDIYVEVCEFNNLSYFGGALSVYRIVIISTANRTSVFIEFFRSIFEICFALHCK